MDDKTKRKLTVIALMRTKNAYRINDESFHVLPLAFDEFVAWENHIPGKKPDERVYIISGWTVRWKTSLSLVSISYRPICITNLHLKRYKCYLLSNKSIGCINSILSIFNTHNGYPRGLSKFCITIEKQCRI